ncbi:mechanosensitive ion channel [Halanaerobium sp. Z-7514]|uniref:Mechanosensitive ion channel n=1 Tax=Halanaerobium polyolivorans TaxID=2886943 RepID=A0AAW4WYB2_9FIRM|nr:mechanosensitive ion channel domain-containing protein [Halanaerobium polyolivorans]MCC3144509.1 mechanosensitive ion channel [Halanaerobium polyolivorans]RQD78008.1 MAG: mechanosensitive ion channel protein MscS [Halanaerobium sp. MSAO_Bac5]
MFEGIELEYYYQLFLEILENQVLVLSNLIEAILFVIMIAAALFLSKITAPKIEKMLQKIKALKENKIERILGRLLAPLILLLLLFIYYVIAAALNLPTVILSIFANLVSAWFVVKAITLFFPKNKLFKFLSVVIWTVAALRILNIYEETISFLDSLAFRSGNLRISILLIGQALIIFSVLLWAADKISRLVSKKINQNQELTPSVRVLLNKLAKFLIFTSAALFALSSLGIDLSAFAFLGGAVGVGLGFGLQKIVSNFISGIIILADKSIKPGDVVEIGDIYGWVKELDTRFVSLVTLAGKEYLIPNEDFITKEVINWSYSDKMVRVDVEIGVSYDSDLRLVEELTLKAAEGKERILDSPKPSCILTDFADSSVNFELRFWISDPQNGIKAIQSQVLFSIWDNFKEHGIEIPYPQRDHHFKSISESLHKEFADLAQNSPRKENFEDK